MGTSRLKPRVIRKIARLSQIEEFDKKVIAEKLGVSVDALVQFEISAYTQDCSILLADGEYNMDSSLLYDHKNVTVINYYNSFHDHSLETNNGAVSATGCTFNPLDKLIEAHEENRKLYERLLESEKNKNSLLEKLLTDKI